MSNVLHRTNLSTKILPPKYRAYLRHYETLNSSHIEDFCNMMDDCYLRVLQNVQEYQMILTLKPGAMMDALTPETPAAPAHSRGQLILLC